MTSRRTTTGWRSTPCLRSIRAGLPKPRKRETDSLPCIVHQSGLSSKKKLPLQLRRQVFGRKFPTKYCSNPRDEQGDEVSPTLTSCIFAHLGFNWIYATGMGLDKVLDVVNLVFKYKKDWAFLTRGEQVLGSGDFFPGKSGGRHERLPRVFLVFRVFFETARFHVCRNPTDKWTGPIRTCWLLYFHAAQILWFCKWVGIRLSIMHYLCSISQPLMHPSCPALTRDVLVAQKTPLTPSRCAFLMHTFFMGFSTLQTKMLVSKPPDAA